MTDAGGVWRRRAARVLVLDETGPLLLVEGRDPEDPADGTWWITPGGGLEPGETFAEAARRELAEETGATPEALVELPGEHVEEFRFAGRLIVQTERFFAARLARFEPVVTGRTELERRSHLGVRWWSRAEYVALAPRAFPGDLLVRWEGAARALGV